MCAGLPSAIGAKMVKPDHAVIAVVGDGGFMMNSQVRLALTTTLHNAQISLHDRDLSSCVAFGMCRTWIRHSSGVVCINTPLINVPIQDAVGYSL